MIDLHCHVLPGLDDGPGSLAASIELCRAAADAGTQAIVATPHVSAEWPLNSPGVIAAACSWLGDSLAREGVPIEIVAGAEVALTMAASLSDEDLSKLHLGDGPWLLVECPFLSSAHSFDRILYSLQERGHRIVLAHPERCPAFQADPDHLVTLLRTGMLSSVTAGSLTGHFGRSAKQLACWLLNARLIHNIASDGHNLGRRPPWLRSELELAGLTADVDWYALEMPRAILRGDRLPAHAPGRPHLVREIARRR